LEKSALIRPGVGRDTISDFTMNLIKHFLLRFTAEFASKHLKPEQLNVAVPDDAPLLKQVIGLTGLPPVEGGLNSVWS
jgi:hypothetical protein